jgi:hypothetical protein
MLPVWLDLLDDGIYYKSLTKDCTEDEWIEAFESGFFADWWWYRCKIAQKLLFDDRTNHTTWS